MDNKSNNQSQPKIILHIGLSFNQQVLPASSFALIPIQSAYLPQMRRDGFTVWDVDCNDVIIRIWHDLPQVDMVMVMMALDGVRYFADNDIVTFAEEYEIPF